MNFKRFAVRGYEDAACITSRDVGGPLSKGARREKRVRNRTAKKKVARIDIHERLSE